MSKHRVVCLAGAVHPILALNRSRGLTVYITLLNRDCDLVFAALLPSVCSLAQYARL